MAKKKTNSSNKNNKETLSGSKQKTTGQSGEALQKKTEPPKEQCFVLKIDIDCEGCATKLAKLSRSFPGVQSAKSEMASGKLTVLGSFDPVKLRDFLAMKTKKKIDLITPQPKNDDNNKENKFGSNANDGGHDKADSPLKKIKDKEPQATTSIIKMNLHCQGCIDKIQKIVSKTKGVGDVCVDKQKETVTVKGTMDIKTLVASLKERFKRNVEIVPQKDKDGGNTSEKKKGNGGQKENNGVKGGGGGGGGGGGEKVTMGENRMDFMTLPGTGAGYGYMGLPSFGSGFICPPTYGPSFGGPPAFVPIPGYTAPPPFAPVPAVQPVIGGGLMGPPVMYGQDIGHEYGYGYNAPGYPAHMKFSDENPNACSVM